jgi:hypothetical protein
MAMPRWHFALGWWLAIGSAAISSLLVGRFILAIIWLGAFIAGATFLFLSPEHGRAVAASWRPAAWLVLSLVPLFAGLSLSAEYIDDQTYVLLALPLAMVPAVWLFGRLSKELSGKLPPNSSLKRTNQSLRD